MGQINSRVGRDIYDSAILSYFTRIVIAKFYRWTGPVFCARASPGPKSGAFGPKFQERNSGKKLRLRNS